MSAYSFSQINKFRTCPKQFEASYITKEVKFEETEATRWGIAVHEALECRLRDKTPLPMNMVQYEGDAQLLESQAGALTVEHKLTIDEAGNSLDWWNKAATKRGILDVFLREADKATIWDWKTGRYNCPTGKYATMHKGLPIGELDFFAMLAFNVFPELNNIKTIYRWLKLDSEPSINIITREQLPILVEGFSIDISKIEKAKEFDLFPAKKGGLCRKWCQVRSCKFCGA